VSMVLVSQRLGDSAAMRSTSRPQKTGTLTSARPLAVVSMAQASR